MASTIKLKNGSGAPTTGDLVQGEPALDLTNKRLYTENASGVVIEVGTNPSTIDINAGTIDGTVIGGSTAAAGSFTTGQFNTSLNVDGTVTADGLTVGGTGTGDADVVLKRSSDGLTVGNLTVDSGNARLVLDTAYSYLDFETESSKRGMRISNCDLSLYEDTGTTAKFFWDASAESLGIGTTSPAYALDVSGDSDTSIRIRATGGGAGDDTLLRMLVAGTDASNYIQFGDADDGDAGYIRYQHSTDNLIVAVNASEAMRIDTSGNLGLGIVPNASWNSSARVLQIGGFTYVGQQSSGSGNFGWNAYQDSSTFRYLTSSLPSLMQQLGNDGVYRWFNAPSGTAGNAITFTQAMTLDASGRLGVGATSLSSYGVTAERGGSDSVYFTANNTSGYNFVAGVAPALGYGLLGMTTNHALALITNNAERARIDTSGNLLVGTTSPIASSSNTANNFTFSPSSGYAWLAVSDAGGVYVQRQNDGSVFTFYRATGGVGSISVTASATAYNTSSDERLKENITDAPAGNIDDIKVRSFDWKVDGSHQDYGMVAQELEAVAPYAVTKGETEDDMWSVDYSKLVPMLIKEIQDLKAEVAALKGAN